MDISSRSHGDHFVLTISGRLAGDTAASLDQDWLPPGTRKWTVNLAGCEYVSSAGLRVFIKMARDAKAQGVSLSFIDVLPNVLHVFDLTGLNQLLDVQPRPREISIDGLEFLSAGVCGQCFRMDEETIVKL